MAVHWRNLDYVLLIGMTLLSFIVYSRVSSIAPYRYFKSLELCSIKTKKKIRPGDESSSRIYNIHTPAL